MARTYCSLLEGCKFLLAVGAAAAGQLAEAAESKTAPTRLPAVEVVGTTPLPGVGLAADQIAAPVQSATGADIQRSNALDLSDFLNRRLQSVHVNEMQGNPFQPDLNYRGYTASPLLGTPQGLSLYLDGVRLNQPFGDVVSWDLIPRSAIASLALMPGSNPLFGLNTLGGALAIQTKDGRRYPGAVLQGYLGTYGRRAAEFEYGGYNESLDWFVTGNLFRETGWREDSPSRVGQLFGKLGWRDATSDLKLTLAYADTNLTGNGVQEQQLLARAWNSVYTRPDVTENQSFFLNLSGNRSVSEQLHLSGNAYYRRLRTRTLNGDVNEESLGQDVYQPGETAANTPFPSALCSEQVALVDEPAEACTGLINRSRTRQDNWGFTGQFTWFGEWTGYRNQFTAGLGYDASRVSFQQSTQLGFLNPDRSVTGLNAFGDGVTGGDLDGAPFDTRVDLGSRVRTWSVYATDTLSIRDTVHLTLSGRFNRTTVENSDRIIPGGGPGSLDGQHVFQRFNPAAGVTWRPTRSVTTYLGYSEGSRAPTAIELGCADPMNPCRLPNSMAGDPPLNQVVTKTWETGVKGELAGGTRWNAGVFRAENHDDILFVAAPNATQFGYFKNFAKTRRQGFEASAGHTAGQLNLGANYTYLDATYQSMETVNGTSNSRNDTALGGGPGLHGDIQIQPGNRIPLIPRQLFKAYLDHQVTAEFLVGLNFLAVGSSYARGNENNAHQPDGTTFLGPGKSPGYGVLNLNAQYRVDPRLSFFGSINNLLDRKYYTAALLGPTAFTANGTFDARPLPAIGGDFPSQQSTFYAPGAPRSFYAGVRYLLDPRPRAAVKGLN
jgi:outer membrane receptor protein involved in Fe transport